MRPRILLVEGSPARRRSYALTLQRCGYSVFQAWDVEAAFEMARVAVPDVLVVDERAIAEHPLPFRWMTADPRFRGARIVVLSGSTEGRAALDRRTALAALGAHAVIDEPVTERDLTCAVQWVLDVYRLARAG